ncbi:MAG: hypothetical protein MSC30_09050 [Gaiellaceae bacterium MAG52_C11]|nr:hypothetical protein [Candidatus Gaiellasilicea maunaloa]
MRSDPCGHYPVLRLAAVAALAAAIFASTASASELIDRNAASVKLQVAANGQALLSYNARGKRWNVLAWGAENAIAPTTAKPQLAFKLDYSGGYGAYKRDVWKTFRNACRPYSGPELQWLVAACTATNGSHWAVQAWQRMLPNYGLAPNAKQAVWELRLSHWSGEPAQLTVRQNWAYRTFEHLFGSFTYQGNPVHGFRTTSAGQPLDTFGRNLYVDTYDSAYGKGWKRENSFLTHKGTGKFCYGFYSHGARPVGAGTRYRATIIGPGVTPDVYWESESLGAYDRGFDLRMHEEQKAFYAGDGLCKAV